MIHPWSLITPEMFTVKMLDISKQELSLEDYKKEFLNYWVQHDNDSKHRHHEELLASTKEMRVCFNESHTRLRPVGVPCRLHGKTTLHKQMLENKIGWDDYSEDELNNPSIVPSKYKPNKRD